MARLGSLVLLAACFMGLSAQSPPPGPSPSPSPRPIPESCESVACTLAILVCDGGVEPFVRQGECCQSCPRTCTEGGQTHNHNTSWTCSDGCNTCRCMDGAVASTRRACQPCMDGGQEYASGSSWNCSDGCNTCSCLNGQVASTDRACLDCRTEDGQLVRNGATYHINDCNFCTCFDGQLGCAVIDCAPLQCNNPVSVPGQCCATCSEGCTKPDGTTVEVGDSYQATPCTTSQCTAEGWINATIACAYPDCVDGSRPVTRHGQCCPSCPTGCTKPDGTTVQVGDSYQATPCTTSQCTAEGWINATLACAYPLCVEGSQPVTRYGQCCPSCSQDTDCRDQLGVHSAGSSWTCADGCNTCSCANGQIAATEVYCGSCTYEGRVIANGDTYQATPCKTCDCDNGDLSCAVVDCPAPPCDNPRRDPDRCCPSCSNADCRDQLGIHSAGSSWTCPDGCNTCSCGNGVVASTRIYCGSCNYEGRVIANGDTYQATPCKTCSCTDGRLSCAIADCPRPTCDDYAYLPDQCCPVCNNRPTNVTCPVSSLRSAACVLTCRLDHQCRGSQICCTGQCGGTSCVDPAALATQCPAPTGFGICSEACRSNDDCGQGQMCCSNGCGHACMAAVPGDPAPKDGQCPAPSGLGTCDQRCSLDSDCEGEEKCCSNGCGHACSAPVTTSPGCPTLSGDTLGACVLECQSDDACRLEGGNRICCSTGCGKLCQPDCSTVLCAYPECRDGSEPQVRSGECCPTCPVDRFCRPGATQDPDVDTGICMECTCNADYVSVCEPCVEDPEEGCEADGEKLEHGQTYQRNCYTCECQAGDLRCERRDGCSQEKVAGTVVNMRFRGNVSSYSQQDALEDLQRFIKAFLLSKFQRLNLTAAQITDIKVRIESARIYVMVQLMDTAGSADSRVVAASMESVYNAGQMVLVHSAVLQPDSSFSAQEQELGAPGNPAPSANSVAIIIPVVLGVIIVAAIAALVVAIVVLKKRTGPGASGKLSMSEVQFSGEDVQTNLVVAEDLKKAEAV